MKAESTTRRPVTRVTGRSSDRIEDVLAVERPLEIRVGGRPVSVTLRTPGHDLELALGFLAGEGVIRSRSDVAAVSTHESQCTDEPDRIELELGPGASLDWTRLERHFVSTSACGICGRAHLESLRAGLRPIPIDGTLDTQVLLRLSERMRVRQDAFQATGGLHAAVWFARDWDSDILREDIGRHNAVDKVCGRLMEEGRYPVSEGMLWVSGRSGAEIVLKAARARIPTLAAVGAPSSLAVELAEAAGMTLIGFLREGRMNVYAGGDRLTP